MSAGAGPVTLAVVDYGMGNLRSVEKALERIGAAVEVTSDHGRMRAADGLVLPGVGAFPAAMAAIRDRGLDSVIGERVEAGVPALGLCLGMQLLFESSAEHEGAEGLGLLEGTVEGLSADGLKLPQIGWNPVAWRRPSTLSDGLPDPCAFYHVHSFAPVPKRLEDVLGTAVYGAEFVSAVARERVFGVQFHPEKSGHDGLALLEAFAGICRS